MNILVTGISSGLGKELATQLLSDGHNVWGLARKESSNPAIKQLIANQNFTYTQCDVSQENDIVKLIEKIKQTNFNLTAVILNAAIMEEDFINKHLSYAKFKNIFEVNLLGAISIVDKILPLFRQQREGVFIGISSLSVYRAIGGIDRIAYPASKSALNMVFEAFRLQLAEPKIRFVIVNLGRLGEKKGILQTSYKQTAKKVISLVDKNKNIINYPLINTLMTRVLALLPDSFVSKHIIKTKQNE